MPIPPNSSQEADGPVPPVPTTQENYLATDPQLNARLEAADGAQGQPEHIAANDNDDTQSDDEGDMNV